MDRILVNLTEGRITIPVSENPVVYKRIGSSLDRGIVGAEQPDMRLTSEQAAYVRKNPLVNAMLGNNTMLLH